MYISKHQMMLKELKFSEIDTYLVQEFIIHSLNSLQFLNHDFEFMTK